jgi:hypothetical protein
MIYDLKKATVRQAAVFKPNELENKSIVKPKAKAVTMNEILLNLTGKVNTKTKQI